MRLGIPSLAFGSTGPLRGSSDPLSEFPWHPRLQMHQGTDAVIGLYEDDACTIPATDGSTVGGFRDELGDSGVVFAQSNPDKRPTLFLLEGLPVLYFDGVDDELTSGVFDTEIQTIFLVAMANPAGFARALSYGETRDWGGFGSGSKWAWFSNQAGGVVDSATSALDWSVMALELRSSSEAVWHDNGVPGATFDPSAPVVGTMTLGSQGGNHYMELTMTMMFVCPEVMSGEDIALVSAQLATLNAALLP